MRKLHRIAERRQALDGIHLVEIPRIADELRRAFDGDPWHGLPALKLIAGISGQKAAGKPLAGANSIWEIVLHMTAWIRETQRRLGGAEPGAPEGGEWPSVVENTEAAWERAKARMVAAHTSLLDTLDAFSEAHLDKIVGGSSRVREAGTGVTFYVMLHGLVQHTVYHSAQIATLRRALAV